MPDHVLYDVRPAGDVSTVANASPWVECMHRIAPLSIANIYILTSCASLFGSLSTLRHAHTNLMTVWLYAAAFFICHYQAWLGVPWVSGPLTCQQSVNVVGVVPESAVALKKHVRSSHSCTY